jgi:hypothetical protein
MREEDEGVLVRIGGQALSKGQEAMLRLARPADYTHGFPSALDFGRVEAAPNSFAVLIGRDNRRVAVVRLDQVAGALAHHGEAATWAVQTLRNEILFCEADSTEVPESYFGAYALAAELRRARLVPVLNNSGRPRHLHLRALVGADRSHWEERARALGLSPKRSARPIGAPHRLGIEIDGGFGGLITYRDDPWKALEALKAAPTHARKRASVSASPQTRRQLRRVTQVAPPPSGPISGLHAAMTARQRAVYEQHRDTQDRSKALSCFALSSLRAGMSAPDAYALAWQHPRMKSRLSEERNAWAYFRNRCWDWAEKQAAKVALENPQPANPERDALVDAIQSAPSSFWKAITKGCGVSEGSVKATAVALVKRIRQGKPADVRHLGLCAGLSRTTAARALKALEAGGLIALWCAARGRMAHTWVIVADAWLDRLGHYLETPPPPLTGANSRGKAGAIGRAVEAPIGGGAGSLLVSKRRPPPVWHDTYRVRGAGKSGWEVDCVVQTATTPVTVDEIATSTGLSVRTVRRKVAIFVATGRHEEVAPDRYVSGPANLDHVAQVLGTAGAGAAHAQRHATERRIWREYLEARAKEHFDAGEAVVNAVTVGRDPKTGKPKLDFRVVVHKRGPPLAA